MKVIERKGIECIGKKQKERKRRNEEVKSRLNLYCESSILILVHFVIH